jgi:hypothetical protein
MLHVVCNENEAQGFLLLISDKTKDSLAKNAFRTCWVHLTRMKTSCPSTATASSY